MSDAARCAPFVTITPLQRAALLVGYALMLAWTVRAGVANHVLGIGPLSLALAVYVALLALPLVAWDRRLGWIHPIVVVSAFAAFDLLRMLPAYATGFERHRALLGLEGAELSRLLTLDLWLRSAAFAAFLIGFRVIPLPRAPVLTFFEVRRLRLKVFAAFAVGALILATYLERQGGLFAHLLSWGASRTVALSGEYYWIQALHVSVYACLVWFAARRRALRSPGLWLLSAASLGMVFVATGSRSAVLYLLFVAFVVWLARRGRMALGAVAALGLVGLFLIGTLGEFRRGTWSGELDWSTLVAANPVQVVLDGAPGEVVERRLGLNGTLPVLARVPQHEPLLLGSSYLAAVGNVIPRALWSGKPRLIDNRTGNTFFGIHAGIPPGGIGEAYWNFHLPGVLLVYALFGAFHHAWARLLRIYPRRPPVVLAFAVTVVLFHDPGGPQLVRYLQALVPIVGLWVLFGAVTVGRRPPAMRAARP